MKTKILNAILLTLSVPLGVNAENIIRTPAPIAFIDQWINSDPSYGEWESSGIPESCGMWTPALDTVLAGQSVSQTATCQQEQTRTVQPRQKMANQEIYRNAGEPVLETRSIEVDVSNPAIGTGVMSSCVKAKQFFPSGASGVYDLTVNSRQVPVFCDMSTDGGGWALVGRGTSNIFNSWSYSRNAIAYPNSPSPHGASTFKLSDADINAISKNAYKVVTTGYSNTRYFKGTCEYNQMQEPRGDCAISYANESWASPRGNGNVGSGGLAGAGGLIDKRGDNVGDGYYVATSLVNRWDSWAAGNGTTGSNVGSGGAGTLISLWIWVR